MTHRLRATLLLLCLFVASPSLAAVPEVFVAPLDLYNTPDLDSLAQGLRSMLASRIEGEGYTVRTQGEIPTQVGHWIVRTSITRLGKIYSLDAALEPAAGAAEGSRNYQTAEGMDKLIPALEQVAEHIRSDLLTRVRMPPAAAALAPAGDLTPAVPGSPGPLPATRPPDVATATRPPSPGGTEVTLQAALRNQRVGQELTGEATSLAVGDVDGDGHHEILMLVGDTIVAFRDMGDEIRQAWDSPAPREFTPTTLSIGDFDGNGLPEVFVAGIREHTPTTQALEWFGSALGPKGGRVPGFLRAVPHPEQGALLLGMSAGVDASLFRPNIHTYLWDGTSYREKDQFPVSSRAIGVNLDFLRLGEPGQVFTVITTQGGDLQGLDANGGALFEIGDDVKGTRVKLVGAEKISGYQDEDIVTISGHTLAYRSPDGRDYLFVYKNVSSLNRIFKRLTTTFSSGQIIAYHWDNLGLSAGPETAKYSGFIADLGMGALAGASSPTLYAALVRTDTGLFSDPKTRLVAYDLP